MAMNNMNTAAMIRAAPLRYFTPPMLMRGASASARQRGDARYVMLRGAMARAAADTLLLL